MTNSLELKAIAREDLENKKISPELLRDIEICQSALHKMPEDQSGLVLGAGSNAQDWHSRGWKTVDLDPNSGATYTHDINQLEALPEQNFDYLLSEYLTLHPENGHMAKKIDTTGHTTYEPAVGERRLLALANQKLKIGGKLIIKKADFGPTASTVSTPVESFADFLHAAGFKAVLVVDNIQDFSDSEERKNGVAVTWYAEKVRDDTNLS